MDLVSAAEKFEKAMGGPVNLKLIKLIESYDYFTSQFYDCFKPYIEDSKEKLDFIESFYKELKSFDRKPIDEKTNEAYCALFDKKVLKKKIPKENSKLIYYLASAGNMINTKLIRKIEMINLNQDNEENVKKIIDVFGDVVEYFEDEIKYYKNNDKDYVIDYWTITRKFEDYFLGKYRAGRVVGVSFFKHLSSIIGGNNEDEEIEYNEVLKRLNKLDKDIMDNEYLLNDGGKKIVRSKNYQNFRNVILEIAKAIS